MDTKDIGLRVGATSPGAQTTDRCRQNLPIAEEAQMHQRSMPVPADLEDIDHGSSADPCMNPNTWTNASLHSHIKAELGIETIGSISGKFKSKNKGIDTDHVGDDAGHAVNAM